MAESFGGAFARVDESGLSHALGAYLTRVRSLAEVRTAKRASFALLDIKPGDRVLDVGCGVGEDAVELAQLVGPAGRVVGIDSSQALIERARGATSPPGNVEFVVADAVSLSFADESFDRCRCDRTLQHVPTPDLALAEMARVTRVGGVVVISEMINHLELSDDLDPVLRLALGGLWTDDERRRWIGTFLPVLMRNAGFDRVGLSREQTRSTSFEDVALLLNLEELFGMAVRGGQTTGAEADAALRRLEDSFAEGTASVLSEFWHITGRRVEVEVTDA